MPGYLLLIFLDFYCSSGKCKVNGPAQGLVLGSPLEGLILSSKKDTLETGGAQKEKKISWVLPGIQSHHPPKCLPRLKLNFRCEVPIRSASEFTHMQQCVLI